MAKSASPFTHGRSEVWESPALTTRIVATKKRLGVHLRGLRKGAGWTQEAASEVIGIHPKHLQRIERGVGNATVATLVAITAAYKVTMASLFDEPAADP